MTQIPPPPPGADDVPPPAMETVPPPPSEVLADIPPPAPESEQFEADLLKRKKGFSWKRLGGEGFLVSVTVHLLLLILALFYVISKYVEPKKKEPDVFSSGSGGGRSGDKAKAFEHKMKARATQVKSPTRIVSKSASASVSLPDTPQTNTASFASGLSAGGMSKGSGGGSGGGEGTGIGIGKGGGKNFVSLFGSRGMANDRLTGYIYDFTQTREGAATPFKKEYSQANNLPWLRPVVSKFVDGGWSLSSLDKYFRGPAQLGVHQILIPRSVDSAAPKAFDAEGKMQGSAWIAVYRGKVRAPESGEIRFCGNADNFIGVRFDGRNALLYDCGKATSPTKNESGLRIPTATGKWIQLTKGQWYDMNVMIGDAGGLFSALLYYERKGAPGKKILFRTEDIPWDEVIKMDTGDLPRDLDPNSPVWPCKAAATSVR